MFSYIMIFVNIIYNNPEVAAFTKQPRLQCTVSRQI